MSHKEMGGEA